ncbi:hypothetical protein PLICRDRAFT_63742, partial [Plicaturopsis crispa FD-325 SS-3]
NSQQTGALNAIPTSIETVEKKIDLQGRTTTYAVCKPIRKFVYYSVLDWISSLLARDDIRHHIDEFCEDAMKPAPSTRTDIRDGEFVRKFKGPDGRLFVDRGDESRLLFLINVDGFATEGTNLHGAHNSSIVISMSCANLPGTIRNDAANLYLGGIIQGPHEPNSQQTQHYLRPLVDDLIIAYERGIR